MCTNPGIKKYLAIYVGSWNYYPSDVGCHEETKCQLGLKFAQTKNSHPKI